MKTAITKYIELPLSTIKSLRNKKNYDPEEDFLIQDEDTTGVDEAETGWYFKDGCGLSWCGRYYIEFSKKRTLSSDDKDDMWLYRYGEYWDGESPVTYREIALCDGRVSRIKYPKGVYPSNIALFKALCYNVGESFYFSVTNSINHAMYLPNDEAGCTLWGGECETRSELASQKRSLKAVKALLKSMGVKCGDIYVQDGNIPCMDINWADNRHTTFHDYNSTTDTGTGNAEWISSQEEIDKIWKERDSNFDEYSDDYIV